MIPMSEELDQEELRQSKLARAEQHRLRKPALNHAGARPIRRYHILLARLGDLLYEAGCSLRTRYGRLVQPAPRSSITVYKGFGTGHAGKELATETGGNSTPCSG